LGAYIRVSVRKEKCLFRSPRGRFCNYRY